MKLLAPRQPLPRSPQVDRDQYLLNICRGKRVLHLACAAWPATQKWCDDGSLLHLRLGEVCERLAGFDCSEPGLRILADVGVEDLHRLNLLERYEVERAWNELTFEPEVVIAGELLEHLDRAGLVLENCRRCMTAQSRMVITVPNAFSLRGFLHLLRGYEKVANDHVGYYSYSNVRELAERNGFELHELRWYRYSSARGLLDQAVEVLIKPAIWLWPQLSEGLIADCGLASEYQPVHSKAAQRT